MVLLCWRHGPLSKPSQDSTGYHPRPAEVVQSMLLRRPLDDAKFEQLRIGTYFIFDRQKVMLENNTGS